MLITTTKIQRIGDNNNDINKRRIDSKNYSIRLSVRDSIYTKLLIMYS